MKMVSVKKPNNSVWNAKFAEQSRKKLFSFLQMHYVLHDCVRLVRVQQQKLHFVDHVIHQNT